MTDFIQENFYAELCDIFHQLRNLQEDAQLLGWVKTEKEMDDTLIENSSRKGCSKDVD